MIVFDASVLLLLLAPDARPPIDPQTGQPVERCKERLDHLIETLGRRRQRVLVPTPTLSEILVRAGTAGSAYLDILNASARFKIVPFDARAAVELAMMTRDAVEAGDKRSGSKSSWAKLKFDRQIVAIARVEGAETIYSDDVELARMGKRLGFNIIGIAEIPLPPTESQAGLFDKP